MIAAGHKTVNACIDSTLIYGNAYHGETSKTIIFLAQKAKRRPIFAGLQVS
jgi:hypothetical protein